MREFDIAGSAPQWRPGLTVGQYALLGPIARGGMGEIWLAKQPAVDNFSRTVIVKRLLQDTEDVEGQAEMLLDEARIASQLHHPNIVQLIDLGRDGGSLFIVMEYLQGENLSVVLRTAGKKNEQVPIAIAAGIALQVARALAYAHAKVDRAGVALQLVHRDVTPQNVILTYDGVAKLIDFGIAKATGRSTLTTEGLVKGKLTYMSPEQARSEPLDGRSDVFALGVSMFELLSGTRFHAATDDVGLFRVLADRGPFPKLSQRAPRVPAPLAHLVDRATEALPSHRPDAPALAAELEAFLAGSTEGSPSAIAEWLRTLFAERIEERAAQLANALRPVVTATAVSTRWSGAGFDDDLVQSGEWFSNVPALDAQGKIVMPAERPLAASSDEKIDFTPEPAQTPELSEGPADDAPLELENRAPVFVPDDPHGENASAPRRSSGRGAWAIGGVAVLLVLVAGFVIARMGAHAVVLSARHTLVVSSEPSGASVVIGGETVGHTPFAADNVWHGSIAFDVGLPGYVTFRGTFEGDSDVDVTAKLKRR